MKKKRSVGVIIYGCLFVVISVILTAICALLLSMADRPFGPSGELISTNEFISILLSCSASTGVLISNIGILLLKEKGRKGHLIFIYPSLILFARAMYIVKSYGQGALAPMYLDEFPSFREAIGRFLSHHGETIFYLIVILFCTSSIFYFTRPKVKEQFK